MQANFGLICQEIKHKSKVICDHPAIYDNNTKCGYHRDGGYHCFRTSNNENSNVKVENKTVIIEDKTEEMMKYINNKMNDMRKHIDNEMEDMRNHINNKMMDDMLKHIDNKMEQVVANLQDYIAAAIKPLAHLIMDNSNVLNECSRNTTAISRSMSDTSSIVRISETPTTPTRTNRHITPSIRRISDPPHSPSRNTSRRSSMFSTFFGQ